jgi:hypothetical protein
MPTAKQMPWPPAIMAVLMPTTRPAPSTSGPPELPGFSGASVCTTLSMRRPERARSVRPSALTMPAVTVHWKPKGLPMATTICPTRSLAEEPSRACACPPPPTRSRAMSVSASRPTSSAGRSRPSRVDTRSKAAPSTTWLLLNA